MLKSHQRWFGRVFRVFCKKKEKKIIIKRGDFERKGGGFCSVKSYLIQIVLLESRLRIIFLEFCPYWLDYKKKSRKKRKKYKKIIKNFWKNDTMNLGAFFSGVVPSWMKCISVLVAKKEAKGRHTKSLLTKKLCLDTEKSLFLKHNFLLLRYLR